MEESFGSLGTVHGLQALFVTADILQPSVIFVDEIDSMLTSRSDNENEVLANRSPNVSE